MRSASCVGFVALWLFACTRSVWRGTIDERHQTRTRTVESIRAALSRVELMDGDLIFRRTDGLRGRIARTSDRATGYSHVGLVNLQDRSRTVIHADPVGVDNSHGRVVRTTLDDFATASTVIRVAVYRLRQREKISMTRAVRWASEQAARRTPFDDMFNLSDSSAMYCTELVWHAYRVAGVTIAYPAPRAAGSMFLIDSLLLLSSIQQSELLQLVYASPEP